MMEKITPKTGCILLARCCKSPPDLAMAIIPKSGKPTPVNKKPRIAIHTFVPANWPSKGGNIILPAPKKIANSINPRIIVCLPEFVWFIWVLLRHTTNK
jgi:hypothetical protein